LGYYIDQCADTTPAHVAGSGTGAGAGAGAGSCRRGEEEGKGEGVHAPKKRKTSREGGGSGGYDDGYGIIAADVPAVETRAEPGALSEVRLTSLLLGLEKAITANAAQRKGQGQACTCSCVRWICVYVFMCLCVYVRMSLRECVYVSMCLYMGMQSQPSLFRSLHP